MTARRFRVLLPLLVGVSASPAASQERVHPAGEWLGVLRAPPGPMSLGLTLVASDHGWQGTFTLPAENVTNVPVPEVRVSGDSVVVVVRPDAVVLRLLLAGDSLSGIGEASGMRLPVVLGRAGSAVATRLEAELASARRAARDRPLVEVQRGPAAARVDAEALARLLGAATTANSDAIVVLHDGELWASGTRAAARGASRPCQRRSPS